MVAGDDNFRVVVFSYVSEERSVKEFEHFFLFKWFVVMAGNVNFFEVEIIV